MSTSEFMTVEEAAALWKVHPERITYTCENNGIEGAAKLSGQWIIPAGISRPVIKQIPRVPNKELSDENSTRTRAQQALIEAFEGHAIPFSVSEHRIGKTTYIVTSCYSKSAKRTMAEAIFSLALRELENQGRLRLSISESEKILKSIRKSEIEKQPSFSQYMKGIEESLKKMDFCEDDVAMLLEKYAEAYQPLEER